mgnify:CR=1 FL=1|jgi:hypothetical protein
MAIPRACFIMLLLVPEVELKRLSVEPQAAVDEPLTSAEIKEAFHPPKRVMAEVQRFQTLGLTEAVGAFVDGTSKIAVGHSPTGLLLDELALNFAAAVKGVAFMDITDTARAENARYRKALFIAGCASLAAEARARAEAGDGDETAES